MATVEADSKPTQEQPTASEITTTDKMEVKDSDQKEESMVTITFDTKDDLNEYKNNQQSSPTLGESTLLTLLHKCSDDELNNKQTQIINYLGGIRNIINILCTDNNNNYNNTIDIDGVISLLSNFPNNKDHDNEILKTNLADNTQNTSNNDKEIVSVLDEVIFNQKLEVINIENLDMKYLDLSTDLQLLISIVGINLCGYCLSCDAYNLICSGLLGDKWFEIVPYNQRYLMYTLSDDLVERINVFLANKQIEAYSDLLNTYLVVWDVVIKPPKNRNNIYNTRFIKQIVSDIASSASNGQYDINTLNQEEIEDIEDVVHDAIAKLNDKITFNEDNDNFIVAVLTYLLIYAPTNMDTTDMIDFDIMKEEWIHKFSDCMFDDDLQIYGDSIYHMCVRDSSWSFQVFDNFDELILKSNKNKENNGRKTLESEWFIGDIKLDVTYNNEKYQIDLNITNELKSILLLPGFIYIDKWYCCHYKSVDGLFCNIIFGKIKTNGIVQTNNHDIGLKFVCWKQQYSIPTHQKMAKYVKSDM
eukprot:349829_1